MSQTTRDGRAGSTRGSDACAHSYTKAMHQADLFDNISGSPGGPQGLVYQADAIDAATEAQLIAAFDALPLARSTRRTARLCACLFLSGAKVVLLAMSCLRDGIMTGQDRAVPDRSVIQPIAGTMRPAFGLVLRRDTGTIRRLIAPSAGQMVMCHHALLGSFKNMGRHRFRTNRLLWISIARKPG